MGGAGGAGTNPGQLFAVGSAPCLPSSPSRVAAGRGLDLGQSRITARVSSGPVAGGGVGLAVTLALHALQLDHEDAAELMVRAHEVCPYSRATRGNIDVELMVGRHAIT